MSDNGYDNIELNELIKDLKNVGNKNSIRKNDSKITFQYSNPKASPGGYNLIYSNFNSPIFKTKRDNSTSSELLNNVKSNSRQNTSQNIKNQDEVLNLQKELTMVKNELTILKRSYSLASHPIFGENLSRNFKTEKEIVSYQNPISSNLSNTPNVLRNNFSSVSNISYKSPNSNNFQYQSLTKLNAPTYSAHRQNSEKFRQLSNTYDIKNSVSIHTDYEETEDCTLQPIGKGIQTLTGSLLSMTRSDNYYGEQSTGKIVQPKISYFDTMKTVKLMKHLWLNLDISREECKMILSDKEMGSFIIRIQTEYKMQRSGGMMFELILKINNQPVYNTFLDDNYEYYSLKEFIEDVVKGIKLIGHAIEPMFPTLDSFVLQHLEIPLGLPCCLILPKVENSETYKNYKNNKYFIKPKLSLSFGIISKKLSGSLTSLSSMKSQVTVSTYAQPIQAKLNAELLFLGKVTVDRLNGLNAIRHAVDKTLINGYQPKHCIEINTFFDSLAGITIVDNERILFFKKILSSNSIIYCDVDPLHRGLNSDFLSSKGIKNAKIFGVVYQKRKILIKENKVIIFAEFNSKVSMETILKFVKNHFIKQNNF